jgi:starch phosphorylase
VRDIPRAALAATEQTYDCENPSARLLSFPGVLIGRSLANIPQSAPRSVAKWIIDEGKLDWTALLEEPDPGSAMAVSVAWRRASRPMATLQLPAMGYGLRYEYGIFRQTIEHGWRREHA